MSLPSRIPKNKRSCSKCQVNFENLTFSYWKQISFSPDKKRCGFRHVQIILQFFALLTAFFIRTSVGIAIVAMTDDNSTSTTDFHEFDWSFQEKQIILSSFNWGYILTQLPGGYLTQCYGSKITLFVSSLACSLLSLATPLIVIPGGWIALCAIRSIQGVFQGVLWPCVMDHLAKWAPKDERSLLGSISFSAVYLASVLSFSLSGFIATSNFGWPGIFYFSGAAGLTSSLFWLVFGASSPANTNLISDKEKEYILSKQLEDVHDVRKMKIPWKGIIKSTPFLSLLLIICFQEFGIFIITSEISIYMDAVLKVALKDNALYSSLPHIMWWIMSYVFLFLAQCITAKQYLSLTALRKLFNWISVSVATICFLALGFLGEQQKVAAISLIIVNAACYGAQDIAYDLNIIDLSPNFSAVLIAISNIFIFFVDVIGPLIIAGIVKEQKEDRSKWQIVFAINCVILPIGSVLYTIFGRTEAQPWNDPRKSLQSDEVEQGL